jgi:LysR family transcriptional regulator, glycine cleavage system transcriptional activator
MNLEWRVRMALNHLAAFESAADKGSFTEAGENLGTTQPSISRHIASLENLLEVQLFTRLHHRVELTDAGSELHDAVKLGLGHIRQAAHRITTKRSPDTLSIGCTYGFAHLWLMPRFSALQKLVPDRELRMVTADTRTLFDLHDVDYALRFGRGDWSDGGSQNLFDEELFPVCSPGFADHHFGGSQNVDPASLADAPLIHEQEEEYSWLSWQQWLARHSVTYEPAAGTYYYDNYALTLQAAIEGQGIALAWLNLAEPPLKSGQLVELEGLRVKTDCGYYLAYRPDQPDIDQIVNWFKEMARLQETDDRQPGC